MGNTKMLEIRENDPSGTYRVLYTLEMEDFVFALHSFQKKSKSGKSTPKQELDKIKQRLKQAQAIYKKLARGK